MLPLYQIIEHTMVRNEVRGPARGQMPKYPTRHASSNEVRDI